MRTSLALAFLLLPALAVAQRTTAPLITSSPRSAETIPARPDPLSCLALVTLTVKEGSRIEGPWSFGPVMRGAPPDAASPIVVEAGAALVGPITLELCDGKLRVTKP